MSDSNRVAVGHRAEVTAGTYDSGNMTALHISSESLTTQKNTVEENTIRSDRNLRGLIATEYVPQGSIGFDFIYGNLSNLITGMMGNSWSTLIDITTTNATVASNVITAASGTPYSSVVVGQSVRITYNSTSYIGRVSAVGGGGATLTIVGTTLADDAVADAVDIKGRYVRNGTTQNTFSLEVDNQDASSKKFFGFLGMLPNTMNLNMQAQQVVTGDMSFLGMSHIAPSATSVSGAAYDAAPASEAFAGLSANIGQIFIDGTSIGTSIPVISQSLQLNNNVRRDVAINITELGWGTFMASGQVTAFFKGGEDMIDDFYSHEDSSLWTVLTDPDGNNFCLYLPTIKWGNFTKNAGGRNQPVIATLDYTAIYDTTLGITAHLDEIAA